MKIKLLGDTISALAIIGLCIFILVFSPSLGEGARTFPLFIGVFMGLFALFIAVRDIFDYYQKSKQGRIDLTAGQKLNLWPDIAPFVVIGICFVYLVLFSRIGFELSGFILMFSIMCLINVRQAVRKFYIALITPVVLLLLFSFGLNLRLPLLIMKILK